MVELAVTEQTYFRARAERMAHKQARRLLEPGARLTPDSALNHAARLVEDLVQHLDQPAAAVTFALNFHPLVEQWSSWGGWLPALEAALRASRRCRMQREEIVLLNHVSQTAREIGDSERATEAANCALQLAQALGEPGLVASALNKLGTIAFRSEDFHAAARYLEQAYSLGEPLLPPLELGHITNNLGWIAVVQDRLEQAHGYFEQALHYYAVQDDPICSARVLCNIASLERREGQLERVVPLLMKAQDVFTSVHNLYEQALTENDLGVASLSLEDYPKALSHLLTAIEIMDQIRSLSGKALVLSNIVELYVTTGQWDQATAAIEEARSLAILVDKPWTIANIDVDHGRMLVAQGDFEGARRLWQAALETQIERGASSSAEKTQQLIDQLPS